MKDLERALADIAEIRTRVARADGTTGADFFAWKLCNAK
jgi:hypothetical protein